MIRYIFSALLMLGFLALAPAQGWGQATTTGQVTGRVLDSEGAPVAGANVVLLSAETGFQRSTVSRPDGTFTFLLIPPGTYSVRTIRLGYRPAEVREFRVVAGQSTTANLQLVATAVALEGIRVTARGRPIDVTDASVSQVVTREEIENLPALGRDFTDFIALSGIVSPTPEATTGGQFAIAGQRPSQTNLQIDGVDANNSFFGENRGGSRIPFVFSLESIREFQVITNGYDVEYGRYSGGVVNVVTRGGTNRFEGTILGNLRNERLTGPYFTPLVVGGDTIRRPRDYDVMQLGGRVSGPLIEDQLFYLFSVDMQRRREPFVPLSPERYLDREVPDPLGHQGMLRFIQILGTQYGVANAENIYRPFPTTNDVATLFGRIDWDLSASHRFSARHNMAVYENDNETFGATFTGGLSTTETFENRSHSFVSELQSVLGANSFNVLRFQLATEDRPRTAAELRPELRVRLPNGDDVRYAGAHLAFHNQLDERKVQLINNFTHQRGDHTFKLGGMFLRTKNQNRFIGSQGAGVYEFASVEDFAAFRPTSYTRRMRADGEVPFADFSVVEWALYAQDEWRVTPQLTATLGLRYDVQTFLQAPGRVVDAERAFGVRTGVAPTDRNNISPRLSLAYDVWGNGSAVARAGVGYFYGPIPYVLGGNVAQTELPVLTLTCRGSIVEGEPDAPPSPRNYARWDPAGADNPLNCERFAGLGGVPEYSLWREDFEFPETFKANLGWEQQLLPGTRVAFDLVHTRSTKLYTVRNLNLRDHLFTLASEDGRRIFQPPQHFDPTGRGGVVMHRRFEDFSNLFVNYNDGQSESTVASLEVTQTLGERSSLRGSYTYTRAFDNSSFSCCTSFAGFADPRIGAFGPNEIGGAGDTDRAWGPSDWARPHTFIFSGHTRTGFGLRLSAIWRLQSGRPWSPEQDGDLNGDGFRFNDRPFIFRPEDLPLNPRLTAQQQQEARARYAGFLEQNSCVGNYVGQIVPRNTCRDPWFNRLDVTLGYALPTGRNQRVEVVADIFNFLNLLNADWGRYTGVTAARRNLLLPTGFEPNPANPGQGRILYNVPLNFGEARELGTNLMLQWQAQLSLKYFF